MVEKEKVSRLSKLLGDAERLVLRCDELDPWGPIKTQKAFLEICLGGAELAGELYKTDPDIIGGSRCLKALPEAGIESLLKQKPPAKKEKAKKRAEIWGNVLDAAGGLEDAVKFCVSLTEERKKWHKGQDYRIKFRAYSQQLAGYLLYDLLDYLGGYDAEEYPSLRLQVLCSYLKEMRVEFLWDAYVHGPCRTDSIPGQCQFERPPDSLQGELTVLHGDDQHEFTFRADTGKEFVCVINNTGIRNYRTLLDSIWETAAGKLHGYPQDGTAVWAVTQRGGIQNLEGYADLITKLLRPLSAAGKYSECAREIRAIVRRGRSCWTKGSHIEWSYLYDLDKCIAGVEGECVKIHEKR